MKSKLQPDREELAIFIPAMFKHARSGTFVSLRAFRDKGELNNKPFRITPVKLKGDLEVLIDEAYWDAARAANARDTIVFAPPVATFTIRGHAREVDLAQGLALSVECDTQAQAARAKLARLLGPATCVVASGGEWVDLETGVVKPKLHVHYRLRKPPSDTAGFAKLKLARALATAIVGSDPTNITVVHPIRWPGSVHRKGQPKLCRIVAVNPKREINLDRALKILTKAAPADAGSIIKRRPNPKLVANNIEELAAAVEAIPNKFPHYSGWKKFGMAIWGATAGSERGFELFDEFSCRWVGGQYNEANTRKCWKQISSSPPDRIGAGSIFFLADQVAPGWRGIYEAKRWTQLCAKIKPQSPQPSPKKRWR